MKPLKEKVSITIDGDILKEIKIRAEECDRSVSQFINLVLKRYVNEKKDVKKEKENQIQKMPVLYTGIFVFSEFYCRKNP